jgi:hypothetical protein
LTFSKTAPSKKHLANWAEVLDRWVTMELGKVNGEAAALDGHEPAVKADASETSIDDSDDHLHAPAHGRA